MYKVILLILYLYFIPSYYLVTIFTWFDLSFIFLQHVISIAGDVAMKMYYEEFPLEANHSPIKLKEWMEKAME